MSLSPPVDVAIDLIRFVVLAVLSVGLGVGLIRLLRIPLAALDAVFAGPAIALSFWAVFLGLGIALGAPVRSLAGPGWAVSIAIAIYGLLAFGPQLSRHPLGACGGIIALAAAVAGPYFLFGLARFPGSPVPDGWSYVAQGQYLWVYPNGTEGNLSALYQYAAHVAHVRRIAGALLGFFSVLVRAGETQSAVGLFLTWTVFVFASSCTFFALSTSLLSRWQLVAYVVFTTASGWISNLFWANNFDNGLALSFAPTFAGLIGRLDAPDWRWHILLGLCTAGLFHVYPELAPVVVLLCVLVVATRWRLDRTGIGRWLLAATTSLGLALVLIWPFIPDMTWFIRNQASAGLQGTARPGESMFPGLLALKFNPSAFWGLGGEYATSSWLLVGNITASLMTVLAACGCFAQLRSRSAGTAAWLVLVASGAMVMILVSRYSYGAYKLILLGWWALGFALILGTNVVKRLGEGTPRLACVVLIAVALAQTSARERKSVRTAGLWDMDAYRSLVAVERLRLSKATLIAVDDAVANTWAVYFLRDAPAALGRYRSYLTFAHVRPFLDRARQFRPEEIGYILTDQDPERVVDDVLHWQTAWSSGPYRLLAPTRARWAVLGDIRNPYGLETFDAKPFFWMGPEPTTLEVLSGSDGILTLQAYFHPGPSVPSSRERRLLLTTDSGHRREVQVGAGPATFRVPTSAGADRVVMQVLDQPTAPAPVRDPRSLLLGVQDLRIGVAGDSVEIRHIANANGSERLDGRPFFWLGAGDTVVTLDASKAGTARLVADFLAGPGGPPQSGRRIRIVADGARARELTVGPGRNALVFPVRAGENRVVLRALDPPVRANNGASDTRSLLMGLRVLRIDLADAPVSSAIIEQIDNPNGLEHVGGEPFLWIGGRRPTRIVVRTDEDGELLLSGRFSFGPSRSNGAVRRLAVALNGGPPRIVTIAPGQQAIPIFVRRGPTQLELTAVDAPQVATLPNGDTRPLIVGVSGLTVLLEATTAGRSSQPVAR